MVGGVYRIPIRGAHHNNPHLHVVVIEVTGSKECICVPAFSADGEEVNIYLRNVDLSRHVACVELDNREMVEFSATGFTGKQALWLVERFRRLSRTVVRRSERIREDEA